MIKYRKTNWFFFLVKNEKLLLWLTKNDIYLYSFTNHSSSFGCILDPTSTKNLIKI